MFPVHLGCDVGVCVSCDCHMTCRLRYTREENINQETKNKSEFGTPGNS